MGKDGRVKDSFPPMMMMMIFALDLHSSNITDVALITAIIFNLPPSPFLLGELERTPKEQDCPHEFEVSFPRFRLDDQRVTFSPVQTF